MGREYTLKWKKSKGYEPAKVLGNLPSPISSAGHEIYNFSINNEGSYFVDHLVDRKTAGEALQMFIDDALAHCDKVEISEA